MTNKRTDEERLAIYKADPGRYKIGSNGSVYDRRAGRFTDLIPSMNPNAITPENSRSFLARKRQLTQMATLRGLAREVGIDIESADLETIAQGAGTALENLVAHNYQTLMKSSNIRGQAESIRALIALLGIEKEEREVNHVHSMDSAALDALAELIGIMKRDAIDGEVIDGRTDQE